MGFGAVERIKIDMNNPCQYFSSSIGRKQIVAVTGILLILFLVGHLAGNLLIYLGPEAFNAYAKKLAGLRPGLYVVEAGLLLIFLIHMFVTALLVLENINARPVRYKVQKPVGERSTATRLMPYTGTIILIFIVWHLLDFTFADKHGNLSILPDGKDYGLFGVVYNAFSNPWHSYFYIITMMAIGFHLSHGVQSFCQTFGFVGSTTTPLVRNISNAIGLIIAVGYSTIPIYVLVHFYTLM